MKKLIRTVMALGTVMLTCSFWWFGPEDCAWCGGRGKVDTWRGEITCDGCKGKGKVEKHNKCEGCKGKGYTKNPIPFGGDLKHSPCHSTGRIPIPLPDSKAEKK